MADLLIHSMAEFAPIIAGALQVTEAANIVEIGAEFGGTTPLLAAQAAERGGTLTSIDPSPKNEFITWVAANPHVRHLASPSLDVIAGCEQVDAWFIDGDHNWYTVYHELKEIDEVCRRDGKPMLVFLHDVAWPCGRRDSYYAPDRIPPEFRQPYDYEGGTVLDRTQLLPGGGFRGMGQFAWATTEGGPRNGVLTAVEDFMSEAGREMALAQVPAVFGLGILFDHAAPWAESLGRFVLPWHRNPLLASLERNRLANYLRVIELQDSAALKVAA
ncbi:class I SAM-dependent methyltransferase [Sphingomonas sp. ID1715]|uniref:class I SAM-dependent methyltransferase n=1 Tax=Sphingomonas sp. ID1715 TaxID=1656898 RepID=UPI001488B7C1|nr:class I SAM-dependent methyltransferase [Sphingomonas sp. ID1715]NNM77387.1 class I SAM-dependent methyltransferase [Sphingomonas sp. ID1715]